MQEHRPLGTSLAAFSALLKACRDAKDVRSGSAMHSEIARKWSLSKICLHSNILIDMYLGCGCLSKAREVFDDLVVRDVVSWTSLMSGYVKHDLSERALESFDEMKIQGVCPNAFTYVCFLKACGSVGAVQKGKELHAHLERKKLWESDPILGNALVDMYVRCGLLSNAQDLFDNLPIRDVVTWTTLIGGYANHGLGMEALDYYKKMQGECVIPNAHTYVCSLKACGILGDATNGEKIHADIIRQDLLENQMVGSALIDMYAKCGLLAKAHEVFDQFDIQDVISWNALIMGYIRHDRSNAALSCYEQMQLKGVSPNAITYVAAVKACASAGATEQGEAIHAEISTKGSLERSLLVGSALVDMYTKCDSLKRAQEVFDNMLERDVVTSNMLIAGYVDHDCYDQALISFKKMESEGLTPDGVTFSCILKACGGIGNSGKGREIHCEAARKGLLEKEPFLGNALIDMYVKSGLLSEAHEVLDDLPLQDVVSWTTLIGGYVDQDHGTKALDFFEQMQQEGVLPNPVTLVCILKACGGAGAIAKGQEIHANAVDRGLLESNLMVGSAIVDMYGKCGRVKEAQEVFDELEGKDIVSWNSLISGYAQQNHGIEALACLAKMRSHGVSPNAVTFVSCLKACGSIGCADVGCEMQAEIDRQGLLLHESCLGNALIDMHAKCGSPSRAQEVFDKLLVRDVVSWNSLIAGYANSEQGKAALECLEKMEAEGVIPDAVTFASILKACGGIGAMERGEEIYSEMLRKGLADHATIGNAVVDLYARCGPLGEAEQLFDKLPVRDVVAWNALIAGYAQAGENAKALQAFARMRDEGRAAPDTVTFIGVLNACSHALWANEAQAYFDSMSREYGIAPALEHYTCLADLLGRCGHVDRALGLLEKMPWKADLVAWHAILDGCRKWGSEERGEKAFRHAAAVPAETDALSYLSMCGIYASAGARKPGTEKS